MAANQLAIANQALTMLGDTLPLTSTDGTVANIVESTEPRTLAIQTFFEQARVMVLRQFPWPFALAYQTLTLNDDGTGEIWEEQWDNAYTYPSSTLRILRFIEREGPSKPRPPRFEIGYHGSTKVIFTDVKEDDADVLYIRDVTTTTEWSVEFDMALSAKLAFDIAMPLQVDESRRSQAAQFYNLALTMAQANEANEAMPHRRFIVDGDFARARFT